jgi:hypothetical protein
MASVERRIVAQPSSSNAHVVTSLLSRAASPLHDRPIEISADDVAFVNRFVPAGRIFPNNGECAR